jgi:plastocyanin
MQTGALRHRKALLGCAIAGLAMTAGACGSSHSATSNTPAASGATGVSGNQVTVGETEFKLTLSSDTFSAGAYTFRAVNNGKIVHSLEITGPGANATTPDLQPGQSAELHVTLQDGSYDLFCPIDSHKSLGMDQEITVGASGAATSSTVPSTTVPSTTVPATTVPSSGAAGSVSY